MNWKKRVACVWFIVLSLAVIGTLGCGVYTFWPGSGVFVGVLAGVLLTVWSLHQLDEDE